MERVAGPGGVIPPPPAFGSWFCRVDQLFYKHARQYGAKTRPNEPTAPCPIYLTFVNYCYWLYKTKRRSRNAGGGKGARVSEYVFQFVAGRLCLDFLNTLSDRAGEVPTERLTAYGELVRWAANAGAVDDGTAAALVRKSRENPEVAERTLQRARRVREAMYGIFKFVRIGATPPSEDMELFNRELGAALSNVRVDIAHPVSFEASWSPEPSLDRPLWPVLRSAADLLVAGDLSRVKSCASRSCEWVFLDESRNRSRQWCQMEVCGNRAKARRHYARTKRRTRGAGT